MNKIKNYFIEIGRLFKTNGKHLAFIIIMTMLISAMIFSPSESAAPDKTSADVTDLTASTVSGGEVSSDEADVEPDSPDAADVADVADQSSGDLGDYHIEILSHRIGKDYEGKPAIFITYSFTNNGEEASSFAWAISDIAFQDGVQLETALVYDDGQYDTGASVLEIKKGATITLEQAYILRNTTSAVEVEVTELISFNDNKVSKTFNIA